MTYLDFRTLSYAIIVTFLGAFFIFIGFSIHSDFNKKIIENDRTLPYVVGYESTELFGKEFITSVESVSKKNIPITMLSNTRSDEAILNQLIEKVSKLEYIPDQPYPTLIFEEGGNCQAFSLWLSAQLDFYEVPNTYYLSEGKDHMAVYALGYIIDLANKKVLSLDEWGAESA